MYYWIKDISKPDQIFDNTNVCSSIFGNQTLLHVIITTIVQKASSYDLSLPSQVYIDRNPHKIIADVILVPNEITTHTIPLLH